jgi:hypothetical protein
MSLLFFDYQGNDLLRAKGIVILDTGHHLTSHPTDFKVKLCTHVYIQLLYKNIQSLMYQSHSFKYLKIIW